MSRLSIVKKSKRQTNHKENGSKTFDNNNPL